MKLKRLLAGVLTAAMMLSIASALAFAEEGDTTTDDSTPVVVKDEGAQTMTFTSTINLGENAISAPNLNYEYVLEGGAESTYSTGETTSIPIYSGKGLLPSTEHEITDYVKDETGKETIEEDTSTVVAGIEFTPFDYAEDDHTVSIDVTFDFTNVAYEKAGIYHYVITELNAGGQGDGKMEVIDGYEIRHVYVTVTTVGDGNYVVSEIIMSEELITADSVTKSTGFLHSYGIEGGTDESGNSIPGTVATDDLTFVLTAYAFGNMASSAKEFTYTPIFSNVTPGTVYEVNVAGETEYFMIALIDSTYNAYQVYPVTQEGVVTGYAAAIDATIPLTATDVPLEGDNTAFEDDDIYSLELTATDTFTIYAVTDYTYPTFIGISDDDNHDYTAQARTRIATDKETTAWTSTVYAVTDDVAVFVPGPGIGGASYEDNEGNETLYYDVATVKGQDDTVENTYDANITYNGSFANTGVILEFAPFALMALAAGAAITLRAVKRRKQY